MTEQQNVSSIKFHAGGTETENQKDSPEAQAFSEVDMEDLILFMMQVQEYLKLLKPFANQSEDDQ